MKISLTFVLTFCLCLFGANCALLGIDFGTEYTKAILVAPGVPFDILLTSESKRKDVSGLALLMDVDRDNKKEFHRKYGTHALSTCIKSPQSCLLYTKPLLGTANDDLGGNMFEYSAKFPGVELDFQKDRDAVSLSIKDKSGKHSESLLVEEVVGMLFLDIKNRALDYWKERSPETVGLIDEVVISVPRYFSESARIALTDAAELAGMKVVALVDDGLAVALDYAQKRNDFVENEKEYHLIFDSGAGATKASLVSITNINKTLNVELEKYAFSDKLNGELFTDSVRALILKQFSEKTGLSMVDVYSDTRAMYRLWQASEKAKLILSANTETTVNIESFYNDVDFKGIITREQLETKIEKELNDITQILDEVLTGFDVKQLKSVILSGGSVRVPVVQEKLISYFGSDSLISKNVNADESVIFGTTLEGAQILKLTRKNQFKLIDRSSVAYDINYASANDTSLSGSIEVPLGILAEDKFNTNLTTLTNKFVPNIDVEVFQSKDNKKSLMTKYDFKMPKKFNETTCEGGLEYLMSYGFSKSDIFQINNIKVSCYSMVNDTVAKIAKTSNMISTSEAYGFKPLPYKVKSSAIKRLNALEQKDLERQKMSDIRNQLEGKLYEIRYLLEEFESIIPSDIFESYSQNVSEVLDWLDYDSDDASLKEVETKLNEANDIAREITLYELFSEYQSAVDNIKVPYDSLLSKKDELNKNIEDIIKKDKELAEECAKYDIDFEDVIKKLQGSSWPSTDSILKTIDSDLEPVKIGAESLISKGAKNFEKISRSLLIDAVKSIEKVENSLDFIESTFKDISETRKDFINHQIAAAKRKASKKEKKEKQQSDKDSITISSTSGEFESTSTSSSDSSTTTATTTTTVHDEL